LTALISQGHRAASVLTRARILLKADADDEGPHWTDPAIAEAVETSWSPVHRVRQAFVEEGLAAALARKQPTGRQYRKLDGAQEAQLIALACSAPPEGRIRWTLQFLADRLIALKVVPSISAECVRTTLNKTRSNRGSNSSG
jgi:transposase